MSVTVLYTPQTWMNESLWSLPPGLLEHLCPQAGARLRYDAKGASWQEQNLALFSSDRPGALPPVLCAHARVP